MSILLTPRHPSEGLFLSLSAARRSQSEWATKAVRTFRPASCRRAGRLRSAGIDRFGGRVCQDGAVKWQSMKYSLLMLMTVVTAWAVFFALVRHAFSSDNFKVGVIALVILVFSFTMAMIGADFIKNLGHRLIVASAIAVCAADLFAAGALASTLLDDLVKAAFF